MSQRNAHIPTPEPPQNPPPKPDDPDEHPPIKEPGRDPRVKDPPPDEQPNPKRY